jgi:hypothetical protein
MAKTTKQTEPANVERSNGKKTKCPITRSRFRKGAKAVLVAINGSQSLVPTKEFSTGSLGWYLNGKTVIEIDGEPCEVQIGMSLTVIGSKELPAE